VKKLVSVIGGVIGGLAAGAAVVALVVFGIIPVPFSPQGQAKPSTEEHRPSVTVMYPTKERIVNLADPGTVRYLKAQVTLEFIDRKEKEPPKGEAVKVQQETFAKEMNAHLPIIEDRLTTVLSSKTSAELLTPAGKTKLKEELMERLNLAFHEAEKVVDIYFTTFIIQ
jgi:flagellar protein FliL